MMSTLAGLSGDAGSKKASSMRKCNGQMEAEDG
jgi:hypothetical protein